MTVAIHALSLWEWRLCLSWLFYSCFETKYSFSRAEKIFGRCWMLFSYNFELRFAFLFHSHVVASQNRLILKTAINVNWSLSSFRYLHILMQHFSDQSSF